MGAPLNPRALGNLRGVLQSHIERGRIPGAVAAIVRGGQVEFFEAMGQLDPQAGTAMHRDAIFRIYSMTKPIVSVAAVMLMEDGVLQMNQPVSLYLPEFANPKVAIEDGDKVTLAAAQREPTVHDLLRHTAGFTYEFLGSRAVQKRYDAVNIDDRSRTSREFCQVLASIPLQDHPGTWFQYSRATDVLGAVVEAASGMTLGRFLQQRVFDPLHMKDTGFAVPEGEWARIAEPFSSDPDTGRPVALFDARSDPAFESGGGGLLGTVEDYLRFLQMLRGAGTADGARLVSRKSIAWMTSDHLGAVPAYNDLLIPGYGFGLGFAVRTHAGMAPQPGSIGQYFWSGIGGTSFFVDPAEDLFAVLMTQAPNQRIFFRNLFRHLVYAALD